MAQVIGTLLITLLQLAGTFSSSDQIAKIIETLINILPTIIKECEDLVQPVKNIIAALSANPAADADQLAALQALDEQCDATFEKEATQYEQDNPDGA